MLLRVLHEHRGAFARHPRKRLPTAEPNATELPLSAPGRSNLIKLQASTPSPTLTRAEKYITTTPDCRPRAPAPSPTPTRAEHLAGLQIVRLCALARRRAPKRTPHVARLRKLQYASFDLLDKQTDRHLFPMQHQRFVLFICGRFFEDTTPMTAPLDPGLLRGRAHVSCDSRGCKNHMCFRFFDLRFTGDRSGNSRARPIPAEFSITEVSSLGQLPASRHPSSHAGEVNPP